MQTGAIADFAVRGERGIDVFRRHDELQQRRSRFECLATVTGPASAAFSAARTGPDGARRVEPHNPLARRHLDAMLDAAARLEARPALDHRFSLGCAPDYPDPGATDDPLAMFVYLDFLRAWMLADLSVARLDGALHAGTAVDPTQAAAVLRLLLDFNRLHRAQTLLERLLPLLLNAATPRAARGPGADPLGYALRLAGDLLLRAGQPQHALQPFEAALMLGANRFRSRRAIAAAQAAGAPDALARHLSLYAQRWDLPPDLVRIQAALARPDQGHHVPGAPNE